MAPLGKKKKRIAPGCDCSLFFLFLFFLLRQEIFRLWVDESVCGLLANLCVAHFKSLDLVQVMLNYAGF